LIAIAIYLCISFPLFVIPYQASLRLFMDFFLASYPPVDPVGQCYTGISFSVHRSGYWDLLDSFPPWLARFSFLISFWTCKLSTAEKFFTLYCTAGITLAEHFREPPRPERISTLAVQPLVGGYVFAFPLCSLFFWGGFFLMHHHRTSEFLRFFWAYPGVPRCNLVIPPFSLADCVRHRGGVSFPILLPFFSIFSCRRFC